MKKGFRPRLRLAENPEVLFEPERRGFVRGLSPAGFHRVAYVDWSPIDDPRPVICVHGLTRQGRDFDHVAARLVASGRRVICPDLPGRGLSDRLANPDDYSLPQYCSDMNVLLAHLGAQEVDWIGTSLGGLIGMVLTGFPSNIIQRLVINNIGPYVSSTGLRRIGQYIQEMPPSFPTIDDAEAYFRKVLEPYGILSDGHWRHLAQHSVEDGVLNAAWNCIDRHLTTRQSDRDVLLDRVETRAPVRLDAYQETGPLIDYYRYRNALRSIDGLQSIDMVTNDIFKALDLQHIS